jgi:hypothetical protein
MLRTVHKESVLRNEIENEFLNLNSNYDNICLVGDFNSRTAEISDIPDIRYDAFSGMLDFNYNVISLLQKLNIDIERKSKNCNRNNFGNILIEFCRNNNMIICNGRVGKDKGVGEFTCKNSSVVDHCIVSPNLLKIINSFSILEPSKLFSDVHSPLSLTLKCYIQVI